VTKKVSIILVNYNGMPHLDVCVPSVLSQTHSNFEVILVDNNSGDGSLEYARSKFPQLIFVAAKENLGYAGGINKGLSLATGEYIAPLNTDIEATPDWLNVMVNFLDSNPNVGVVTPKILLFDERRKVNTMGSNIHVSGIGFCRGLNKLDDTSIVPQKVSGVSGCSYLIRRELLERIGGVPETSFMGNDDVVLSWLVNMTGRDIYCVPEAVIYHKYKLRMNAEKFFQLEQSRHALLLYSLKPWTFILILPILVFTELLISVYCLMKGRSYVRAKLRAWLSVYKDRKFIRARRRQVQKLRRVSDLQLLKRLKWNLEWGQLLHISK